MAVLALVFLVLAAVAQEFEPTKPIRMVLPYLIAFAVASFAAVLAWRLAGWIRRRRQGGVTPLERETRDRRRF